jgi:hypothetical protein
MSLLNSLKDLQDQGCRLCSYEQHQAKRFLEGIANDGVNDPPLRHRLRQKGGFCPKHLHIFVEEAHILSSAILLEDLLSYRFNRLRLGKRPIIPQCEACEIEKKSRDNLAKSIRRSRNDAAFLEFLLAQDLCITHLELVTQQLPEKHRYPFVLKQQKLLEHLAEVIRKHDYRFVSEGISEDETQSIKEALGILK